MGKYIKFNDEMLDKIRTEFEAALSSARMVGGEFTFKRTLSDVSAKATLRFTENAYRRMRALVQDFDKEVAWNMVTHRGEEENEYWVTNILVYPQTVTGVNVDRDMAEYAKWIQEGIESGDERFMELHGQGHSHVNMGTSPSGTDLQHQRAIIEETRPNGFYIFVIWNKKDEHTAWIYDLGKNIVFEDKDIRVVIGEDDDGMDEFLKQAHEMVKTNITQPYGALTGYNLVGGYTAFPPATKTASQTSTPKQEANGKQDKSAKESKPAAAACKKKEKIRAVIAAAVKPRPACLPLYDDCDDDIYELPTSPFYVRDNYWR